MDTQQSDPLEVLNDNEKAFVRFFCQYRNAAKAAREAGYSVNSAKEIGYQNLNKPHIAAAISTLMEQSGMSAGECIGRLTAWGRGTMEPFLDQNGQLSLTSEEAVEHWHLIKKIKQKKTVRTSPLAEETIEEVYTEIEIHDAKDAVDKMLQIHGRYKQLPGDLGDSKTVVVVREMPGGEIVRPQDKIIRTDVDPS
jgi:phage terminase small subunit